MKYNFKNIAFFATAILAMGAFSACSNEIENIDEPQIDEPQKETKTITFTTTLGEDNPLSRTSYEEVAVDNGIELKTKWNANDVLYVGYLNGKVSGKINTEGNGYVKATIVGDITNDGKTATFQFTPEPTWQVGDKLNVFYGNVDRTGTNPNKDAISINIKNFEYKNSKDFHLSRYDYMTATTELTAENTVGEISLEHRMAVIKFTIKGLVSNSNIKYFEIKSADNSEIFSTTAYLNNNNTFSIASNRVSSHYTHNTTGTDIPMEEDGTWNVYLVVGPTADTAGKDIIITAKHVQANQGGDIYTATLENFSALEAGKVYVTHTITMKKQETTVQ